MIPQKDLLDQARHIILAPESKDLWFLGFKDVAEHGSDEELFEELKAFADQVYDKKNIRGVINSLGIKLVRIIVKLYPDYREIWDKKYKQLQEIKILVRRNLRLL